MATLGDCLVIYNDIASLKSFEKDVADFGSLSRLVVSNVHLEETPAFLNSLGSTLTYLSLSHNDLSGNLDLSYLSRLTFLDVSHNAIIDFVLPASITTLRCNNNEIKSLSFFESSVYKVEELWLSFNNIEWEEFVRLIQIRTLKNLVTVGNSSCDDNAKFLDFICAILPSLQLINGVRCENVMMGKSFFDTVDGRLMLNQCKLKLGTAERLAISAALRTTAAGSDNVLTTTTLGSSNKADIVDAGKLVVSSGTVTRPNNSKPFMMRPKDQPNYSVCFRYEASASSAIAVGFDESTGIGYVSWPEDGRVACQWDGTDLRSYFSNGSIACMYNSACGKGSVMTRNGRVMLMLDEMPPVASAVEGPCPTNAQGTRRRARVMDKQGKLASEYYSTAHSTSNSASSSKTLESHTWTFEAGNLVVEFVPDTWEIKVRIENDRAVCEISPTSGIRVLREKVAPSLTKTQQQIKQRWTSPGESSAKHSDEGGEGERDKRSESAHDTLRTGLHAVMAELDSLLSGMKSKS